MTIDLRSTLGGRVVNRAVVHVVGADAERFLQGQLSQDLAGMAPGGSRWALLLEPTGKVTALLRCTRTDDAFLLDVEAGFGEAVRERLARFLLRTAATVEATTWSMAEVRGPRSAALAAPAGVLVLDPAWPGVEGVDLLAPDVELPGDVPAVDADAVAALRIEAGVPRLGAELTGDTIPAEGGAALIERTVSFTKGCFTGQELVARIDSRGGNVPHPVRALVLAAPVAVGDAILADGAPVGHVTSTAVSPRLGPVALAVVGRTVEVGDADITVATATGPVAAEVRATPMTG